MGNNRDHSGIPFSRSSHAMGIIIPFSFNIYDRGKQTEGAWEMMIHRHMLFDFGKKSS
jgi:hypothetical protein